ncbi:MAG: LysM peptidoglycan-binding domain-containing protein [Sedimentisphaerales bacterium]
MDVKIGMIGGTVLCLVAIVWFCVKQQIVPSPLAKIESQQLGAAVNKTNTPPQDSKPIVIALPYKQIQPQVQKSDNAESIIHTVTQGQTLIDISKIYYNTPLGWKKIYEVNKEKLPRGPDTIRVGMQLIIPQKD